jgi:hypothetical protein
MAGRLLEADRVRRGRVDLASARHPKVMAAETGSPRSLDLPPAAPDCHPARSRRHPKDHRPPRPLPLGAESRPRPSRVRRRRVLIGSSRAQRMPSCLRRETPSALIRPARGRLTAGVCQPMMPRSRAGVVGARGGGSCALRHRLLGGQRAASVR